jgi:serine/threonine protein kinase
LLLALSEGRREAEAAGEGLGDIRPKNIFLNEEGKIKVANSLSWPLESTNIQKAFDKVPTYLAPEDLASIAKGETIDIPSDPSEAFSIGLTVLSAGNLADYEGIYDLQQNSTMNQASLNEALGAWAFNSFYSEVLRGAVLLLLNVHPERRLNCRELYELLEDHTEAIQKKENFVINKAPAKLH